MSKKTAVASEPLASLNVAAADAADQAEADRLAADAADQAEADGLAAEKADQAEADRLAAEKAVSQSSGVLLRRECIQGVWYPHGALLTCSTELALVIQQDGALDLHPAAVEHAQAHGADQLTHQIPEKQAE